ncbi:MAG: outer membrane beta-barrel protein [Alphaproteobacteria bacterium]|nr:outer membrane beta-barrel protein [Alphaproteobacteria bacterium]
MKQAMKWLGASALSLMISAAGEACAATNDWYAGISGDVSWLNGHYHTGGGGNVDLGYRFAPTNMGDWRLEGEIGYHTFGGDSGYKDAHYYSYMGNLYYDIGGWNMGMAKNLQITPYLGAGLGDATVDKSGHSNSFAYQGMAGLNFTSASMPNVDWSLGYRYFATSGNSSVHANNIEAGVKFHF